MGSLITFRLSEGLLLMLSKLYQPYPSHHEPDSYLRAALLISITVAFLLSFFQPFEIDDIRGPLRWWSGPFFGLATLATMGVNYIWHLSFPAFFRENGWTLGKEIIWAVYSFCSIAFSNYLLGSFLYPSSDMFHSFGPILSATVLVGLLPYVLLTYVNFTRHLRQNLAGASNMNQHLPSAPGRAPDQLGPILPLGGKEQGMPDIHLSELLGMEAEGNYLRLYVHREGKLTDFKLRGTLKEQVQLLSPWPNLFRSHRAFIVNLDQVQHVEGNAAGYRLRLHPELPEFPVSRSQVEKFKMIMEGKD
ncbi:MAG: LytTR family DNA-binding domain-containing protein [Bacteroidota bacterium]